MGLIQCIMDSEELCTFRLKIFSNLGTVGIDAVDRHIFIKIILRIYLDFLTIIERMNCKIVHNRLFVNNVINCINLLHFFHMSLVLQF